MRRIYRSSENRLIGGVCGGFGEYFGIDPVIVRVVMAALIIGGIGIFIYLLAWLVIPEDGNETRFTGGSSESFKQTLGVILVAIGIVFLLKQFWIPMDWDYFGNFDMLIPVTMILLGLVFIVSSKEGAGITTHRVQFKGTGFDDSNFNNQRWENSDYEPVNDSSENVGNGYHYHDKGKQLKRSRNDRMLLGICGGLGLKYGIDPTLVRLVFVLLTLISTGIGVILYAILWVVMPLESPEAAWQTFD